MILKQAAQRYLDLTEAHDGSARHGYKVNAAYNRFMDALSEQHDGDGRFTPPGKAEAVKVAREIVGGDQ